MGLAQARLGRVPVVTIAALAVATLVFCWPALVPYLVYERDAVLGGEIWRVVTGSWVHFSMPHLVIDIAALAVVGPILERRGAGRFALFCLVAAAGAGSAVHLLGGPELSRYGGLSGVVTAAFMYLALLGALEGSSMRRWYLLLAAMLACKIAWELAGGGLPFVFPEDGSFVAAPTSHLGGAIAASLFWLVELAAGARRLTAPAMPINVRAPR